MRRVPRLVEVRREAVRNVISGTAKTLLALLAFSVGVGAITIAQARGFVGVAQSAEVWRGQGSAIFSISYPSAINAIACEALNNTQGVIAAGAVKASPSSRLAALPSTDIQTFDATPGMGRILNVKVDARQSFTGVWLAADLAEVLGFAATELAILNPDSVSPNSLTVNIAGVYPYPSDGRATTFAYSIVSPTPAVGLFDSCWVEIWPENPTTTALLLHAYQAPEPDAQLPQIQQFNSSSGQSFGAGARLEALPTLYLTSAAVIFASVLTHLLIRSRRLELASALHAGIDKLSLLIQLQFEVLMWTIPAILIITPIIIFAAKYGNPDYFAIAAFSSFRTLLLSIIFVHVATFVSAFGIKENQLFRHFKQR